MSGKSKTRREAKAADRAARGNQRAQAELQRRWHLTLKQQREVGSVYAQAASEFVAAHGQDLLNLVSVRAVLDAQPMTANEIEAYEPHCLMAWREQMAGMDDMGGVDTALTRGDAE